MFSRQDRVKGTAPRSTSHGKSIADVEPINDLPLDLAVSDAELAALELLLGWNWLAEFIQTCGGSEADV